MIKPIKRPHDFWMETCGYDTYHRSPNHARLDTPWNAFRKDRSCLVCTVWVDRVVPLSDPSTGKVRQFVKMGGISSDWVGLSKKHGRDARANIDEAIEKKVPILGYLAQPDPTADSKGQRAVQHFFMDPVHQLKPWIGLRRESLEAELPIEEAFQMRGLPEKTAPSLRPTLFELVDTKLPATYGLEATGAPEGSDDGDEANEPGDLAATGGPSNQECAKRALPVLVRHVLMQQDGVLVPLTYKEVARRIKRVTRSGVPWGRGMGDVLGRVTKMIDSVSHQLEDSPPFLTAVVVNSPGGKQAGLPGPGVEGRWHGYTSLTNKERESRMQLEHQRILAYGSRWNDVLRLLGMPPIQRPASGAPGLAPGGWGGGESEAHKSLKRYVLEHPELVGATTAWQAQEEYALRSRDEIDVMFRTSDQWIGVEVKSTVSDGDPSDYERGIYQVIKYRAVLQAQAAVDHPVKTPSVKVFLLLQGTMPAKYRSLLGTLDVPVLERIGDDEA